MSSVGCIASINQCAHATFDARTKPLVKSRMLFQAIVDDHQCPINDIQYNEYDEAMPSAPVYPIVHTYTEQFEHAGVVLARGL